MFDLEQALNTWILDKDNIFFHGTSVESLKKILRRGRFYQRVNLTVAKTRLNKVLPEDHERIEDLNRMNLENTLVDAYSIAKFYAKAKALHDYLRGPGGLADVLKSYDEPYDNYFFGHNDGSISRLAWNQLLDIGKDLGYSAREIKLKVKQGLKRKGVVIGIHRSFLDDLTPKDFQLEGFYVIYPSNLETKSIGAIYVST
ncbi:MAG: hypothetical protein NTY99_00040, partial [DPANN group archaeon]|nr:hypothetical protein [DPANN group archaeon]